MLIFGIMIASIGVLYTQIAPTLLGYQTRTTTTNQLFIFQSISHEYMQLASSSEGTVGRVHIISDQTQYDVAQNNQLTFDITNDGVSVFGGPQSVDIGGFQATINGSFQPADTAILNRVADSGVFIRNNSTGAAYMLTSDFSYSTGSFTMYFRARVDTHFVTSTGTWKMTLTILQVTFLQGNDGSPVIFPIEIPEWTLRLRRQATNITQIATIPSAGAIALTQNLAGTAGPTYTYPAISGQPLDIEIIIIPVLFNI